MSDGGDGRAERLQIGVIGSGSCDAATAERARRVGGRIARRGHVLVTGGLGGVMEAASRGAREAGGLVVGVLPGGDRRSANAHVDVAIATNMGHARNVVIAHTADVLIAIAGEHGTLSEIAIALTLGKGVVGLGTWEIPGLTVVMDPDEAVRAAEDAARG